MLPVVLKMPGDVSDAGDIYSKQPWGLFIKLDCQASHVRTARNLEIGVGQRRWKLTDALS